MLMTRLSVIIYNLMLSKLDITRTMYAFAWHVTYATKIRQHALSWERYSEPLLPVPAKNKFTRLFVLKTRMLKFSAKIGRSKISVCIISIHAKSSIYNTVFRISVQRSSGSTSDSRSGGSGFGSRLLLTVQHVTYLGNKFAHVCSGQLRISSLSGSINSVPVSAGSKGAENRLCHVAGNTL
jgi:hypothetical protein